MLECIIKEPKHTATASVIWLHGLGADGYDFADIVPELGLAQNLAVRFIFPHAPIQPVTLNAGMAMRAWFDIVGLDPENLKQSEPHIVAAANSIHELVTREMNNGIPAQRIVLAGFSQGGTMAIYCGLTSPHQLAGVIALSTFLPNVKQLAKQQPLPFFFGHGTLDPVIPMAMGQHTFHELQQQGFDATWHSYPMPHSVCQEELIDIGQFLNRVLTI